MLDVPSADTRRSRRPTRRNLLLRASSVPDCAAVVGVAASRTDAAAISDLGLIDHRPLPRVSHPAAAAPSPLHLPPLPVVKVVMCSRGGSASEVETHKNIDAVLHTKTTFQAHSIFSVSIQK